MECIKFYFLSPVTRRRHHLPVPASAAAAAAVMTVVASEPSPSVKGGWASPTPLRPPCAPRRASGRACTLPGGRPCAQNPRTPPPPPRRRRRRVPWLCRRRSTRPRWPRAAAQRSTSANGSSVAEGATKAAHTPTPARTHQPRRAERVALVGVVREQLAPGGAFPYPQLLHKNGRGVGKSPSKRGCVHDANAPPHSRGCRWRGRHHAVGSAPGTEEAYGSAPFHSLEHGQPDRPAAAERHGRSRHRRRPKYGKLSRQTHQILAEGRASGQTGAELLRHAPQPQR
jgi:hypothetical protein